MSLPLAHSRLHVFGDTFAPKRLLHILRQRIALARSRRALAGLSDAQLHDIGLNASQAAAEARRPIWDAPTHWQG